MQRNILKPYFEKGRLEAGCDEAGRGCLAGPVVAAAVILPPDFDCSILDDSKSLSAKEREFAEGIIKEKAVSYSISEVDNVTIDRINILQASFLAMHGAINTLSERPAFLLIDGNRFKPFDTIIHKCIIKGDATYASIAAASIIAKTHRDKLMEKIHVQFPQYSWNRNKGYGTKEHVNAIREFGNSSFHRKTFIVKELQNNTLFDLIL